MNLDTFAFIKGNEEVVLFIFFPLFGVLSLAELVSAFFEKESIRKIIKPFLMFDLMLLFIFLFPYQPYLYIGCLFGMLGDIFFIFKDRRICVYFGILTFFLNHVFYIMEMITFLNTNELMFTHYYPIYSIVYSLFTIVSFFGIKKVLKIDNLLALSGCLYMSILFLDLGINILIVTSGYTIMTLGIIGLVLFIISDSILSYTMFIKNIKRKDFYIMSTYLAAQVLFASGIISLFFSL